jgi:hypothetical protein
MWTRESGDAGDALRGSRSGLAVLARHLATTSGHTSLTEHFDADGHHCFVGVRGGGAAANNATTSALTMSSSTSKKIVCSAVLSETDGTSMVDLSVVAKTKQKGD